MPMIEVKRKWPKRTIPAGCDPDRQSADLGRSGRASSAFVAPPAPVAIESSRLPQPDATRARRARI
jgi:hypothetical protein